MGICTTIGLERSGFPWFVNTPINWHIWSEKVSTNNQLSLWKPYSTICRDTRKNRILSHLPLFFKISRKKFPNSKFVVKKNFSQEYLLYSRMFKSYVFFLFEFMNPQTTHTYIYIKM